MLKKSYLFIGTLVTAGIVTVASYNIINASSQVETKNISQIQQIDYSKDIEELKGRLTETEIKISTLEEKIDSLEEENESKDTTISNLQLKTSKLQNNNSEKELETTKQEIIKLNSKIYESENRNKVQNDLIQEKTELESELKIYTDRITKIRELQEEKSILKCKKNEINNKIMSIPALGNIDNADAIIKEYTEKVNSAKTEKEKKTYEEVINTIKTNVANAKKVQELKNQLKEIEDLIEQKKIDEQINSLDLSEQENARYNEISTRIGQINEELLKY